jgi:hypothetical protein
MATSGTYNFTVTRDTIINAALRALGVLGAADTATAADIANCSEALNLIIKNLSIEGAELWTIGELQVPLVAGVSSYTIGPTGTVYSSYRPLRLIDSCYIRDAQGNDVPLQIISRQEYNQLGQKNSLGVVNQIFYDPQIPNGVLYVFNTPIDSTRTIHLVVQRPIQDVVSGTDNFDLPQEWFLPLKWMLAEEICSEYGASQSKTQLAISKAAFYRERLPNWSQEEASVMFVPDPRMGFSR